MRLRSPVALAGLCGVGGVTLSWFLAQHSLVGSRWRFFIPLGAWIVVWMLGASAATRIRSRRAGLVTILALAAALRLAAASGTTPSISDDLYRYGWDAHVQLSGVDPYRYPPEARQLADLRVAPYFPTPGECARLGAPPGCTNINRPTARTIYPPVAQAWFDVVAVLVPGGPVRRWQFAGAAVDLAAVGLLMIGLSRLGREPATAAWYALCPIPVVEFAGNGHVDGLAVLFLLAALLALQRDRRALAGALIGMATMVKLYPAVAAFAAWRRGRWPVLAAFAAVVTGSYAPHIAAVGARVLGYLPGYLREEHYSSGGRFLLIGMLGPPPHLTAILAVAALTASTVWVMRSRVAPETGTAVLLTVLVLLTSPVQPWYAVGLACLGALAGAQLGTSRGWVLVAPALLGELYYAAVILDEPHQVAIGRLCYGAALLIIGLSLWHAASQANGRGHVPSASPLLTNSTSR